MTDTVSKKRSKAVLGKAVFWRRIVQLAFLALILSKGIAKIVAPEAEVTSVDAICPFGGVETLWKLITQGSYLQRTHPSNLVLGLGLLVATLAAGGVFCGWICPLGTLQDWLTALRKRLRIREAKMPAAWGKRLSLARYLVLALVIFFTAREAKMVFASYDPYRTIFSLDWITEPSAEKWIAYVIAVLVLVGSFFIERMWCRFLCPLGAVIGVLQRLSVLKIRRNPSACINCGLCTKACPAKIKVHEANTVASGCIGCLECVDACPRPEALGVYAGPNGRRTATVGRGVTSEGK